MLSIYQLPNRRKDERVIKVVRRDVFILVQKIALFLLLIILPVFVFYLMLGPNPELLEGELSYSLIVLSASFYYLFIWLFFFFSFLDYYLDVWVITSRRIIDVEQRGFFSRVIGEHGLNKIQDVVSETHGVAATFLGYGDVHVQTAGTKQRFRFHQVPNPEDVRDLIIDLIYKYKKEHPNERVEAVANVEGEPSKQTSGIQS